MQEPWEKENEQKSERPDLKRETSSERRRKKGREWRPHLVFLIHGLNGSPDNFDYVTEALLACYGDTLAVHACAANNDPMLDENGMPLLEEKSHLTCDGIDAGGRRIADEVLASISTWQGAPPLSISFWGHSLGGIYARYAIAELMEPDKPGFICGLPCRLFLTTASPHLGVAGTFSSPLIQFGEALGVLGQDSWLGRSGEQLFLEDPEQLVIQLGTQRHYLDALESFQYRLLVANVCNDKVVDFCVAALQRHCPDWLQYVDPVHPDYQHVVFDSADWQNPLYTLELTTPLQDYLFPSAVPELKGNAGRDLRKSKFMKGSTGLLAHDNFATEPQVSIGAVFGWDAATSWVSSVLGIETQAPAEPEVSKPESYCSGHPHEAKILKARRRLSRLPWRLVCMRFCDYPLMLAHNEMICKEAWMERDGVNYITQVVLDRVFGKARRKTQKKNKQRSEDDGVNDASAPDSPSLPKDTNPIQ